MQIELDDKFKRNFQVIFEFIAKDKISDSKNFKRELFKQIDSLVDFPYKYRKSYYFDDDDIRDMTFKGYTVVYEVLTKQDSIIILNIFNKNKP
jgi:plasmid stabilization system protein ParE